MADDKKLSAIIARKIFALGDNQNSLLQKASRLAFKYPAGNGNEREGGGLSEGPLAAIIERILKEHRSY